MPWPERGKILVIQGGEDVKVLLMIPDWRRDDQTHEADHVCRVWVEAIDPATAAKAAQQKIPEELGWTDYEEGDLDDYSAVAVYPGHIFDLLQV